MRTSSGDESELRSPESQPSGRHYMTRVAVTSWATYISSPTCCAINIFGLDTGLKEGVKGIQEQQAGTKCAQWVPPVPTSSP